MYGQGGGQVLSATTGVVSTVAGVAVMPNTGGNVLLMILSIATTVGGMILLSSFAATRMANLLYRK